MADKEFFVNINGLGVSQLIGTRIYNVADATEQTTVETTGNNGGALGLDNIGYTIYRVDLKQLAVWDGTQFVFQAVEIGGDIVFRGSYDASLAIDDVGQPQPIEPISGYQYVVTVAGTFNAGSTGVTLTGSQLLRVGDQILFTSPTTAVGIQRNIDAATETTEGEVFLATQQEVLDGVSSNANEAVTPATLQGKLTGQFYVRQYTATVNIPALTPLTVTHNLNLVDRNSFTINVMRNNSSISVDVDSIDANSITLTSLVALNGVRVTIQGARTL